MISILGMCKGQYPPTNLNAIIYKFKNFLWNFHRGFAISIKFWTFNKKYEAQNLSISEITESKRRDYSNVKKILF